MNPLLARHLYSSARRNRFFVLLSLYLLGVGILTLLFTLLTSLPVIFEETTTISMLDLFTQGRTLYWFSSIILLLTAGGLVPINALGALAGERENHTLDLLVTTTLKAHNILLGKAGAALLTGAVYVLAPLPLLMMGFWLGGVTSIELLLTLLFLILTMLLSIMWAIYISSITRKTIAAVIVFYGVNLGLIPIMIVVATMLVGLYDRWQYVSSIAIQPMWIETLIQYGWVLLAGLHPLSAAISTEVLGMEQASWFWLHFSVERFDSTTGTTALLGTATLPSPWIVYTATAIITILCLFWMTTRRLRQPER